MSKSYISKAQLVKLQTLWGQRATAEGGCATQAEARERRLAWASELMGRELRSFNELTRKEAAKAIDQLAGGSPASTQADQARGTEGRKAKAAPMNRGATRSVTMAGAEDLARIQDALSRLGWDQARFEAWLRSPTSPLGRRANPQIRTVGEANRVWWALKRLLKRAGQWHPDNPEAA